MRPFLRSLLMVASPLLLPVALATPLARAPETSR